jgi:hypothetical protein
MREQLFQPGQALGQRIASIVIGGMHALLS